MLVIVAWFALVLSALSWTMFVFFTCVRVFVLHQKLLDELRKLRFASQEKGASQVKGTAGDAETPKDLIDLGALAAAVGALAGAFKNVGPISTAAALCVICLIIALVAAHGGIG